MWAPARKTYRVGAQRLLQRAIPSQIARARIDGHNAQRNGEQHTNDESHQHDLQLVKLPLTSCPYIVGEAICANSQTMHSSECSGIKTSHSRLPDRALFVHMDRDASCGLECSVDWCFAIVENCRLKVGAINFWAVKIALLSLTIRDANVQGVCPQLVSFLSRTELARQQTHLDHYESIDLQSLQHFWAKNVVVRTGLVQYCDFLAQSHARSRQACDSVVRRKRRMHRVVTCMVTWL